MIVLKWKFLLLAGALGVIPFFSLLVFVTILISEAESEFHLSADGIAPEDMTTADISETTLAHQPMVEQYAEQYDIPEYVPMLLALIEVESGGTVNDVMQSSESLGLPPNTLDTDASIEQGTQYLAELLQSAEAKNVDEPTALQAYNYGGGFIDYVAERGRIYSFELAEAFAAAQSDGERVTYNHPVAVEENGGWRYGYGNMFYVDHVLRHLNHTEGDNHAGIEHLTGSDFPTPDPSDYGGIHPEGECTYYVDNRRREIGAPLNNSRLGDAGSWVPRAEASDMSTGNAPRAGAVMVYDYCQLNVSCRYGHVAFVETVNDDGSVLVSEMNWEAHNVINYRTVSAADAEQLKYIY
ncbi:lysozyme family protein [Jeotgalicoccus sp. S0W5]|uniref:lysozyme family protein n=1 Tax=Jeotgalicoccus sp. S0W5 TaxID=2527874 RepID=UPI001414CF6B|nr:lysozyme family protein [Jeotgalicoccus sp. S0W5]